MFDAGTALWNMKLIVDHAAARQVCRQHQLGPGVQQQRRDPGQLQRVPDLGHVEPGAAVLKTSFLCPASQSDVSVYKNLLFVSAEGFAGRLDCGAQGVQDTVSTDRLRGLRIFDITDIDQSEVHRQRADLPRVAHAHGARRSERQGQRLRLHLGLRSGALAERAAGLLRRAAGLEPELGPLPHRSDQGAGGQSVAGRDRQLAADLRGADGAADAW